MANSHADAKHEAERDAEQARQALTSGDLPHAIHHIGCALVSDPTRPEWLSILNEIIGKSPDPLALVPIQDGVDFVTAATRAWIQGTIGNYPDALSLIGNVAKTRPDVPFLVWAEWWLGREGVVQSMDFDTLMSAILVPVMRIASSCPTPMDDTDDRKPNVEAGWRLVQRARQAHPQEFFIFIIEATVSKRLGQFDHALALAHHAATLKPNFTSHAAVAGVLRDMDRIDEAVAAFREALKHENDISAYLDIGDTYLEANRLEDAARAYQEALKVEAEHPWAEASLVYLRYRQEGQLADKVQLMRMRDDDRNDRAAALLGRIEPKMEYVNWLPRGGDASCNAVRSILERMFEDPAKHHGSVFKLSLSHVESPSVIAAFRLQMEMWGPHVGLEYKIENVPQPDPRVPKAQVPFQLWAWQPDGSPMPAVQKPDPAVGRVVFELCEEPYHLIDVWAPRARELARGLVQQMGPQAALQHLLGTMAHAPRPPSSSHRVLMWVQRVQVAAAMLIAHLDEGWQGSVRQQALYALAYGPVDWSVDAAIVALAYLARTDPAIRADVLQVFGWLRQQIPREGFTCYELPLAASWLHLGGHDAATEQQLRQWIDAIMDGTSTTGSQVRSFELVPKPFDQAAEMAKAQQAQTELAAGAGGDPDPVVFPGQPVARLSDYVRLMKGMQTGDMMGAIGSFGLDMTSYGSVAMAWGQRLAADPTLTARFSQMMAH